MGQPICPSSEPLGIDSAGYRNFEELLFQKPLWLPLPSLKSDCVKLTQLLMMLSSFKEMILIL